MQQLTWTACTLLLLVLQAPLLRHVDRWWLVPDVVTIAVLYLSHRAPLLTGLAAAVTLGLTRDALSLAAPVGTFTEIAVLTLLAARGLGRRLDLRSPLPTMATAGAAALLAVGAFLVFEALFHRAFDGFAEVARAAPSMALATMLAAPLQFWLLDRVGGWWRGGGTLRVGPDRLR